MRALVVGLVLLGGLVVLGRPARAEQEEPKVYARVVVAETGLRAGPGLGHRVIENLERGDVVIIKGREGAGFWLRVVLADGRRAFVLGDTVEPIAVDGRVEDAPTEPGLFAPPALQEARGGLAMLGGFFDSSGFALIEPAVVLAPSIAIEPFAGIALSKVGRQILYGGGPTFNVGPDWPIAPFVHVGLGGLTTTFGEEDPRDDSTRMLARAGGGLLISLRWRILVRVEAMHNVLFEPDFKAGVQSYAAGLGSYF